MKRFVFLAILFLIFPFCLVGCENSNRKYNEYFIDAVYNEQEHSLSCKQRIEYFNNSDNVLNYIPFFVYANAYTEGQKAVPVSYENKAYPDGVNYGTIEFNSLLVGCDKSEYTFENNSIVRVDLQTQLFPKESVLIEMDYIIRLAKVNHRLGFGQKATNLGNFFPIACVYVDGVGFIENSIAVNGDPFFSEVANFEVSLTCSKNFVVAFSGELIKEAENDEMKNYKFDGKKIRDFAIVLSTNFEVVSQQCGDVEIKYFYYDEENASHHLQTAVDAVKTFENLFGEYKYSKLSVVKTNFCFGGMEYPNLVMVSDDLQDVQTVDYVIVHEIAHQWWYAMVGNDQFSQAWIDEGLTEFSCALFYENNPQYGMNYASIMDNARSSYKKFVEIYTKIIGDVDESLNRSLSQFATEPEYVNCVYTKGMLLFDSVRNSMSDKKFFQCLKNYFEDFCYEISTQEKLIESFSKSARINLEVFFNAWIDGKVVIN